MTLSGDQFALPGMESMRRADPHEQTAVQFHNRPDVFVHGRYERTMSGSKELDLHSDNTRANSGFHAGTERAAHERLQSLGTAWADHSPRFYHGRVDSSQMQNTAAPGDWEHKEDSLGGAVRHAGDPGRMVDQGEEWRKYEHGSYYRNDYEDKGSTSVILPLSVEHGHPSDASTYTPQNFQTHREAVSDALKEGKPVPSHVRAVYDATGGESGPKSVFHPHFDNPRSSVPGRPVYDKHDQALTTQLKWAVRNFGAHHQANDTWPSHVATGATEEPWKFPSSGGQPPF